MVNILLLYLQIHKQQVSSQVKIPDAAHAVKLIKYLLTTCFQH